MDKKMQIALIKVYKSVNQRDFYHHDLSLFRILHLHNTQPANALTQVPEVEVGLTH